MNNCSIGIQWYRSTSIGEVTFTKYLKSVQDCVSIQYDSKVTLASSTDINSVSNGMNNYSISSQWHSPTSIGEVTFIKYLVSFQDYICIQYDITITLAFLTVPWIDIHIWWQLAVAILNDMVIPYRKMLLSLVDSKYMNHDAKILFAFSTDTNLHIHNKWKTAVSLINNIFLSR